MKFAERPLLATLASAAVLLAATGCSVLEPDKIDYKSAGRGVSLEVPPDLTQLPGQSRYAVTGGAATASGYQASQAAAQAGQAPAAIKTEVLASFKQYREQDGRFYFKLVDATGQVLLQSRGFDSPREAGQAVKRLQTEGAAALDALGAQLDLPGGPSPALRDALQMLQTAQQT